MKRPPVRMTDHALLRYLERVGGFNLERIRRQLERRITQAAMPGASAVVIDSHRFVLAEDDYGQVVTTVIRKELSTTAHKSRFNLKDEG